LLIDLLLRKGGTDFSLFARVEQTLVCSYSEQIKVCSTKLKRQLQRHLNLARIEGAIDRAERGVGTIAVRRVEKRTGVDQSLIEFR
jgi:hypothetical protein